MFESIVLKPSYDKIRKGVEEERRKAMILNRETVEKIKFLLDEFIKDLNRKIQKIRTLLSKGDKRAYKLIQSLNRESENLFRSHFALDRIKAVIIKKALTNLKEFNLDTAFLYGMDLTFLEELVMESNEKTEVQNRKKRLPVRKT